MPIRVLVVDDSAFMRKAISDLITSDPEIEVVGTARNGLDAIEKTKALSPDVITLDVQMPVMDGIEALRRIMVECPTRVLMLSSLTRENSEETISALSIGAIDFIAKPSGAISLDIHKLRHELITKVKVVANARLPSAPRTLREVKVPEATEPQPPARFEPSKEGIPASHLVIIGSSTGGPSALFTIMPRLSPEIKAGIIIVQHMPPGFTSSLARRLNSQCQIPVKEAETGDVIMEGTALVAPGGHHLTVVPPGKAVVTGGPPLHGVKPAIDITMKSAVEVYKSNVLGVILTGMGFDGAAGMALIKKSGGKTIAEDEASCVVYGMPRVVVEMGNADVVAPLDMIPQHIMALSGRSSPVGRN